MLRRSMLAALALCAFVALESCGVNRLTGPGAGLADKPQVLGKNEPVNRPRGVQDLLVGHPIDGDGGDSVPGHDPIMPDPYSGVDSLRTSDDNRQ